MTDTNPESEKGGPQASRHACGYPEYLTGLAGHCLLAHDINNGGRNGVVHCEDLPGGDCDVSGIARGEGTVYSSPSDCPIISMLLADGLLNIR